MLDFNRIQDDHGSTFCISHSLHIIYKTAIDCWGFCCHCQGAKHTLVQSIPKWQAVSEQYG